MQLHVFGKAPVQVRLLPAKLLLIMRLTAILILAATLHVNAGVYSQEITLSSRNITLEKAFRLLEAQTGYSFLWNGKVTEKALTVSIDVKKASLNQVLDHCLQGTGLTYRIKNKVVMIQEAAAPGHDAFVLQAAAPPVDIEGQVLDEKGEPADWVDVMLKGANKRLATTNDKGYFVLQAEAGVTLVFTGNNIETTELKLDGKTNLTVRVKRKIRLLDEVQIIAYGTTTRRKGTGAVSSVTSDDIAKQNITNPLTALQGRIAGAVITQDNGLMGSAVRVSIRGAGSNLSQAGYIPLYIVDGVPFTLFNGGTPATDNLNSYGISGANGGLSPLSMINPADIERIDVLKDADATAIYGSRGANGVIIITTKKGGNNRTVFSFNLSQGFAKVNHFIPMMNTQQYLEMRKEAFANAGVTPTTSNALDLTVWDQHANTNWQKWAIGGTATNTTGTASVSGGNAQTKFMYSSTYHTEGTVYPGSYTNNMFSNRINASHSTRDGRFNINLSAAYSYMKNGLPSVDLSSIYNLPPNFPLYNKDGSLNFALTSPMSYLMRKYTGATSNLISNLVLSYELIPGLKVKTNLGYTSTSLGQNSTNPSAAQNSASSTVSQLQYAKNDNSGFTIEPQAEYTQMIGEGRFTALLGGTFQQNKATGITMQGTGFSNDNLINSISSANTILILYNNYSLYRYTAFFGKLNYSWQNKYIIDATARRDGSSRFGAGHRFGNFGAIGAAWLFTEENFMKKQHVLSFGKLRGSYGLTGNDQIMDYQYTSLYNASSFYTYNGSSILYPSSMANPDLHWEKTTKLDLALELGFLKDKILFKADYYRNITSDVLTYITTPTQSGFNSYSGNLPAQIQNNGFEFELNTTNISRGRFRWTTSFNFTIPRSKLLSYPNLANSSYSNSYIVGQPTNLQKVFQYQGVDTKSGLPLFKDLNGDGQITYADDRAAAPMGRPLYGGINNSISYGGFSLDVMLQFNHRMGYLNSTLGAGTNTNPIGYSYANQTVAMENRWRGYGDHGYFPLASVATNQNITNFMLYSSSNWGDASFAKLKTVSLSYTLPLSWLKRIHFSAVNVYAQGQNIFTWSKQKYTYDPETSVPGADPGIGTGRYIAFPPLRTIVFGLNCSF